MTDQRTLESQIAGLSALKNRLSESSFARTHLTKLTQAAEALGSLASANDGSPERPHRLAKASQRYLDSIQRTKAEIAASEAGGYAALNQEASERLGMQPDRYASDIARAFGRATQQERTQWLAKIAESGDGRSLAAILEAPDFVTGVDRETLGKFRGVMESKHCPDIAEKRETFNADLAAARNAIEQASRIAESALKIEDVDSAIAARQRAIEAQAQFDAATE
ncbi:hypothetical protein [Marinobacter sp. MBR-105]|jgi:hypothetical protein